MSGDIILRIEVFTNDATERDLPALNALLRRLTRSDVRKTWDHFERVMSKSILFLARDLAVSERRVVGMATLVPIYQPLGVFASAQDLAVDDAYQGRGVGSRLIDGLEKKARELGIERIEFTSNPQNPDRKKAISIYEKRGYTKIDTSVYVGDPQVLIKRAK